MDCPTHVMAMEEQQFMAFTGLIQWLQGVIVQRQRLDELSNLLVDPEIMKDNQRCRFVMNLFHCDCNYFAIAAKKCLEYKQWSLSLDLFQGIDFSEIDAFSSTDIRDLRNMREHIVEYLTGSGHCNDKWIKETPGFSADASSVINTSIGNRLDWVLFSDAAQKVLSSLLVLPIPYPKS